MRPCLSPNSGRWEDRDNISPDGLMVTANNGFGSGHGQIIRQCRLRGGVEEVINGRGGPLELDHVDSVGCEMERA